jgi:hypothetical protein
VALSASQIVSLVAQITKQVGKESLIGQQLNLLLAHYCHIYDIDYIQKPIVIQANPPVVINPYNIKIGYPLPSDYLRMRQLYYNLQGNIIDCGQLSLETYNDMFAGEGTLSYPSSYATDPSQNPKQIFLWPPVGFAITLNGLYRPLMPDIISPESSSTVPWYTDQRGLVTDLCGEACKLSDDTARKNDFMQEAEERMRKYFTTGDDDKEGYAQQVKLDTKAWRNSRAVKPTKNIPW